MFDSPMQRFSRSMFDADASLSGDAIRTHLLSATSSVPIHGTTLRRVCLNRSGEEVVDRVSANGGEDRIRTCGGCKPTHAFQACPLSRSGTSPRWKSADRQIPRCIVPVKLWRRGRDSNPRSRLPEIPVFETGAFNHSATSPGNFDLEYGSNNCKSPLATTYFPTPHSAVSSALRRFTSVFGMGTGGSIAL